MYKKSKSIIHKVIMVLMAALFLASITGCCPGGPGCDWYSGDNDSQQKSDEK